mmetsp:Transcript_21854/g.35386  ORF Transcript_21854/g.35386 Transcript_21854/m.35386 type:complete len:382 (+) Transcript_21854:215-1360(+)
MEARGRGRRTKDPALVDETLHETLHETLQRHSSAVDIAKHVVSRFEQQPGGGEGGAMGLLQTWQRHAKGNKHAVAMDLDKQRVKEKYKKPPRPPMKPLDLWWQRALMVSYACDLITTLWFLFLAFVYLPGIDQRDLSIPMDALAWNLSFGLAAVFVAFKNVQTILNIFTWFKIWLSFVVLLTLGLFYGALRYWMYIYFGAFPCFRGNLHNNLLGFCANGIILVALTWACLYLLVSCFFLHYWRQYKMQRLKEQGKLEEIKTVSELLDAVDDLQNQAAKSSMMGSDIVDARRRGTSSASLSEHSQIFLGNSEAPALDAPHQHTEQTTKALPVVIRASSLRQQHSLSSSGYFQVAASGTSGTSGSVPSANAYASAAHAPQERP